MFRDNSIGVFKILNESDEINLGRISGKSHDKNTRKRFGIERTDVTQMQIKNFLISVLWNSEMDFQPQ